ncbi:MAG: hypothetical protein WBI06_02600 [Paludibacter sp.]
MNIESSTLDDFQFDFVELKIKRWGIVSLSISCASLTGGYSYLAP